MFASLSKTARIIILSAAAVYLVLLSVGLVVLNVVDYFNLFGEGFEVEQSLPYIFGLTLGGPVHTAVKIIMIERALTRAADTEDKKHAKNMGQLFYFGRFVITIVVLVIGAVPAVGFVGFFGTAIGVFSMRLSVYIGAAVEARLEKKREEIN